MERFTGRENIEKPESQAQACADMQRPRQIADLAPSRIVILVCCFAGLWLAMLLAHAGSADHTVLVDLHAQRESPVAPLARKLTQLGRWPVLELALCTGALLLLLLRRPWFALLLVAGSYLGHLLVHWQKLDLGLARPDRALWLVHVNSPAFPSGHAAESMFVYVTLALMLARTVRKYHWVVAAAVLLALVIGITRVVLGVHWPTDVIAGWSFGAAWAVLSYSAAITFDGIANLRRVKR